MQMGFDFGVEEAKEKISTSYSEELMHDARTTYAMDVSRNVTVSCS